MKLNILGKNSDDKGNQLEKLTSTLLKSLGCSNIIRNEIGSGGHEIDVRAEYTIPSLNEKNKKPLICECKAYKATVSMPDWLRFLGKVLIEEGKGHVDGYFIALSGANGNVLGNYRELQTKRNNIKLITGDELIKTLSLTFKLVNIENIQKGIERFTQRKLVEISLYYYNLNIYFLIGLSEHEFTLFSNRGEILNKKEADEIVTLINENTNYQDYVNLEDENNAIIRFVTIKKHITSFILLKKEALTFDEINNTFQELDKPVLELKNDEIDKALNTLIEKSIICKVDKSKFILKIMTQDKQINDVVLFFKYFIDSVIPLNALGCELYNKNIDKNLLNEVCNIQGGISIPEDKQSQCLNILKWSPSALRWSLEPDQMIISHRTKGKSVFENTEKEDTLYFFQRLIILFSEDYKNSSLKEFFFKTCKIVELESNFNLKIKSSEKLELEMEYTDRIGIGQMTEEYNNQYILMRIFNKQPEPWERPQIKE